MSDKLCAGLQLAVKHIEHMAAWIANQNKGYSFESLGEDMPAIQDAAASGWECMSRKQSLPEPGECYWPDCGCDPYATKVIQSLLEQGWGDARKALEPFARYAMQMEAAWGRTSDDSAFYGIKRPGAYQITYGDFRCAAKVYAAGK